MLNKLETLLSILLEVLHNNTTYWVDFGTLLGLVRENNIIPWDKDIDISTWENDFEITKNLFLNNPLLAEYRVDIFSSPSKKRIDILTLDNIDLADIYAWKNEKDKNGINRNCDKSFEHFNNILAVKESHVGTPIEIKTKYGNAFIPEFYEDRLIYLYGNDWQTPDTTKNYWSWSEFNKRRRNGKNKNISPNRYTVRRI